MSKAYVYSVRRKQALITEVGQNLVKFTVDFLNELGREGELVVNMSEHNEPSGISAPGGAQIPYYVIICLTAKEVDPSELPPIEDAKDMSPETNFQNQEVLENVA